MVSISEIFIQSQLSLAAYAEGLYEQMPTDDYEDALVLGGMSKIQAIDFANKYKVIDQYTDQHSGFSGTVFQDTSGKIFMAMRGTEDINDWSTDIADIGFDGIAIDQGIAMYNWYKRLTTPADEKTVTQYESNTTRK